jgi:uncharacterized protein (TIGR02145 family)
MKKVIPVIFIVLVSIVISFGQAPQSINYQAVARDTSGAILTNQDISVKITILKDSIGGSEVYQETHSVEANSYGLINLAIGTGTVISGIFSQIGWDTSEHYLKVEIDPAAGSNYLDFGTTQLLSVPYALYSAKTGDTSTWRKAEGFIYSTNGRVGIGTFNPDSSATLEVSSTNTGFLPPRLTWVQIQNISNPATGLVVFNITDKKLMYYDGNNWFDCHGTCRPQPTIANAGSDQSLANTDTATLAANTPLIGTGIWSIVSGDGGEIADITNPISIFLGLIGETYILRWTISNSCGSNFDDVVINFLGRPCPGIPTVTYEGQIYNTVLIGTQCWMAENLNVGMKINSTTGGYQQTYNDIIEKYCYNNDIANCAIYGGLYEWDEAMQYVTTQGAQGICPDGWHLPTDGEWTTLTDYLGGESVAGGKMKEPGFAHWNPPNGGATNESGFTGLPAGIRSNGDGTFNSLGYNGYFWSSSQYDTYNAWNRGLGYDDANVSRSYFDKEYGFSVRCLKDL